MKLTRFIPALYAALLFATISYGQTTKKMTDYLGIHGPVMFEKKNYNLSWTSHPSATYYKHEYLPAGENADKFKSMLMIEVVTGNLNIKDIAAAKVEELKKMKETNPVVNYETFDNPKTGEYMIDFLLTANTPQGKISIAERNVYRYKTITVAGGQKAILLFGVSTRSYDDATTAFIASLKGNRKTLVNQVAKFDIPTVKIAK